ncbi:hypothetical protein NPIL_281211 [Nephila pilipes]|uniref:Uncharacterized protein n=1 Tax=Nephila pilipes TaxID=299642 RepID=A0A8X6II70_NEPPI|nr:hypothetical protein NPIL_281211 [Nephila pilipes]
MGLKGNDLDDAAAKSAVVSLDISLIDLKKAIKYIIKCPEAVFAENILPRILSCSCPFTCGEEIFLQKVSNLDPVPVKFCPKILMDPSAYSRLSA